MGSTRCTSASHSGRRLIGKTTGEYISTTKIRAFTTALVTSGLPMSWAVANPIEVAISDDSSSAGTTIGDTVRLRPYRQAASARVTTIPGIASSVNTVNVEATAADRGAGSDQMKSQVPAC